MSETTDHLEFDLGSTWGWDVVCRNDAGDPMTPDTAIWRLSDETGVRIECAIGSGIRIETVDGLVLARIDVAPNRQSGLTPGVYEQMLRTTEGSGAINDQSRGTVLVRAAPPFDGA